MIEEKMFVCNMKKFALLIVALMLVSSVFADKKQLSALFSYSTFYLPGSNQPYVETYLDFDARSLVFEKVGEEAYVNAQTQHMDNKNQYRATVEVTLVVRKAAEVAYVKKYELKSPVTTSDTATAFTFLDMQRFSLPNGIYDLELSLHDKASAEKPAVYRDKLVVFYEANKPSMSNIQLMSDLTPTTTENMLSRNGYDMVPFINNFVDQKTTMLKAYYEIYNLDREVGDKPYIVRTCIEQQENGRILRGFENYRNRPKAQATDAIIDYIDIAKLPSGNYSLVVEVMNLANEVLMKKSLDFQRSNPKVMDDAMAEDNVATSFAALITDEEQLDYYLDALYPIASSYEVEAARNLTKTKNNVVEKQTFFYRFWMRRNALDPESDWLNYRRMLTYVDEHFSYPRTPGYMTDRGRVYLQYGPPDFIRDEKNFVGALHIGQNPMDNPSRAMQNVTSSATDGADSRGTVHYLPYQLWRYNLIAGEKPNSVFLFWDEMRSGYYRLLNSSVRSEVHTPFWERVLSQNQLDEDVIGEVGEQFDRGY